MSNKTWLSIRDLSSSQPSSQLNPIEFDIYKDAENVAKYILSVNPVSTCIIIIMSYDNPSGEWYNNSGFPAFTEIGGFGV